LPVFKQLKRVFNELMESRMFPQLEVGTNRREIIATEVLLFEQPLMLSELMYSYAASLQEGAGNAEAAYMEIFNRMIAPALGIAFGRGLIPRVLKSTRMGRDD
jgi:hypothetical protein